MRASLKKGVRDRTARHATGLRALVLAACGLTLAAGPSLAEDLSAGPAEPPPAGFAGRYYVDSRGCVFLRSGTEGAESWVPRRASDGSALCGFRPSVPAQPAPGPVLSLEPDLVIPAVPAHGPREPAENVADAQAPAPMSEPSGAIVPDKGAPLPEEPAISAVAPPDEGTEANGGAVRDAPPAAASERPAPQPSPGGLRFVQVATLASPANVEKSLAIVAELGLPVQQEQVKARGRTLTVIIAGPFDRRADLLEARRALRKAGFTDAFLRK
jgi:cell division septation protein DedD